MAPVGSNCPIEDIISSEDLCKQAISRLNGLIFQSRQIKQDSPAGCYVTNGKHGYFNSVTDPTKTNIRGSHARGLCKETGIVIYILKIEWLIFNFP